MTAPSVGVTPSSPPLLMRLARAAVTQPIGQPVPSDDGRFWARKGWRRLALRVIKRRLEVALSGQAGREVGRIDPAWRRAIWFHAEAPQIGDSLLDLAPRSLLAERGIAVDIVLPAATLAVFRGDRWFAGSHGFDDAIDASRYDVAIVDSSCWKAIAGKRRHAPLLSWLSVRRDYLAYDYQRGMLATRRFAELLGIQLTPADELRHARQKLDIVACGPAHATGAAPAAARGGAPAEVAPANADAAGRVAITLGGVRPERTYRAWPQVAAALHATGCDRFTLLGSSNGSATARAVRDAVATADVLDLVGKTDILGTQRAMAAARAVLCVDGGLMHLACTTRTPMLGLFDATSLPAWRVPIDYDGEVLLSPTGDVNDIGSGAVVDAGLALLDRNPPSSGRRPA